MQVLLLSTYDLGRQPFGLASPAAWLGGAGHRVTTNDLAVEELDREAVRAAGLIAVHLPMHTATRLAASLVPRLREINPRAHLCFYGLYAPLNERYLRGLGGQTILGGEFEQGLTDLARRLSLGEDTGAAQAGPRVSLARQRFAVPERSGLPSLDRYARLHRADGSQATVGYTEASRGCKHLCRHCPVVPVYGGRFRIVQTEVVLEDVDRQVAAGADHVTFGDPDFFNGVGHALRVIRALHRRHPRLTYDVTIKVEHLLRHAEHLPELRRTGCLFVTSAVEALDDRVLGLLDKGHSRVDFARALAACRDAGLELQPTFIAFHPWQTLRGYHELLSEIAALELIDGVAPVQLALRLLVPAGSRLLELAEVRRIVEPFDERSLTHPWRHADPRVDALQRVAEGIVTDPAARHETRRRTFARLWEAAGDATGLPRALPHPEEWWLDRTAVPYLNEPWYC